MGAPTPVLDSCNSTLKGCTQEGVAEDRPRAIQNTVLKSVAAGPERGETSPAKSHILINHNYNLNLPPHLSQCNPSNIPSSPPKLLCPIRTGSPTRCTNRLLPLHPARGDFLLRKVGGDGREHAAEEERFKLGFHGRAVGESRNKRAACLSSGSCGTRTTCPCPARRAAGAPCSRQAVGNRPCALRSPPVC